MYSVLRRKWWVLLVVLAVGLLFWQVQNVYSRLLQSDKSVNEVLSEVDQKRVALLAPGEIPTINKEGIIRVLLLGLDARQSWDKPHCDAIHMFTLDTKNWAIHITSVPRGTYAPLPPAAPGKPYLSTDYYMSNACGFGGLDYGQTQIEKFLGVKADYRVTVDFSQVYGIMRVFSLPTTESLQWLRNRHSYAIGDPQRSHNQAVFIKDLIVSQLNRVREPKFTPVLYVVYNMVHTDMDFGTVQALAHGYADSQIDQHPEKITLELKPSFAVTDLHFDFKNPDAQIDELLGRIRGRISTSDLSDKPLAQYQSELIAFLDDQFKTPEAIAGVCEKQLWLQIEDAATREDFEYRFIVARVKNLQAADNSAEARDLVTKYIIEKQALDQADLVKRGQDLLTEIK